MSKIIVILVLLEAVFLHAQGGPGKCGPPPHHKDVLECCDMPMLMEEPIIQSCADKYGMNHKSDGSAGPPPGSPRGPRAACLFSECVFNETKLAVNGEVDVEGWKQMANSKLADSAEWMAIVDSSIDKCVAKGNEKDMPPRPTNGGESCNMKFAFVGHCVVHDMFINCPAANYKASPECDEMKEFMERCAKM